MSKLQSDTIYIIVTPGVAESKVHMREHSVPLVGRLTKPWEDTLANRVGIELNIRLLSPEARVATLCVIEGGLQ